MRLKNKRLIESHELNPDRYKVIADNEKVLIVQDRLTETKKEIRRQNHENHKSNSAR